MSNCPKCGAAPLVISSKSGWVEYGCHSTTEADGTFTRRPFCLELEKRRLESQLQSERAAHEVTRQQLVRLQANLAELREAIEYGPPNCMSIWGGLHGMSIGVSPDPQGVLDWAKQVFPKLNEALNGAKVAGK